jgi:hypothetical protein
VAKVPAGSQVGDSSRARQATQQRIVDELAAGGSVFWVFPLVNESEHFEGMASANQARTRCTSCCGASRAADFGVFARLSRMLQVSRLCARVASALQCQTHAAEGFRCGRTHTGERPWLQMNTFDQCSLGRCAASNTAVHSASGKRGNPVVTCECVRITQHAGQLCCVGPAYMQPSQTVPSHALFADSAGLCRSTMGWHRWWPMERSDTRDVCFRHRLALRLRFCVMWRWQRSWISSCSQ